MRFVPVGAVTLLIAHLVALPTAAHPATAQAPTCKGRDVTILGTDGPDNLRGTNKRDVILALDGDDRIDGRGGNDVICGGAGRDLIKGGQGQDKIFGGADGRSERRSDDGVRLLVGDVVQGGPGDDLIDLGYDERQQTFGSAKRDRLSYKGSAFRVIVTLGSPKGRGHAQGDGRDLIKSHPFLALLGSDKGDTLTGSTYGDEILGRGGADHIDGGGGRDVLVDGPIGSRVGDDVLVGGIGRDTITSYGGRDDLDGGSSADLLTVVHVSPGTTYLRGGPGADVLTVGALLASTCVVAEGGAGSDELVPTVSGQVRRARWTPTCAPGRSACAAAAATAAARWARSRASRSTTPSGQRSGCAGSCWAPGSARAWCCTTAAACWRRWGPVATRWSGARGTTTSRAAPAGTSSSAAAARTSRSADRARTPVARSSSSGACEIPA